MRYGKIATVELIPASRDKVRRSSVERQYAASIKNPEPGSVIQLAMTIDSHARSAEGLTVIA